jgi:uncharacterized protein (TIGR03000 family)
MLKRLLAALAGMGVVLAVGFGPLTAQDPPAEKKPAGEKRGDDAKPAEPAPLPDAAKVDRSLVATITLRCPANATVWIEDQKMTQTGPVRSYQSPALQPNKTYYYKFKVSWPTAAGQPDQVFEKEVTVRAGQTTLLDFNAPGGPAVTFPAPTTAPQYAPYSPYQYQPPPRTFFPRRYEGSGYR